MEQFPVGFCWTTEAPCCKDRVRPRRLEILAGPSFSGASNGRFTPRIGIWTRLQYCNYGISIYIYNYIYIYKYNKCQYRWISAANLRKSDHIMRIFYSGYVFPPCGRPFHSTWSTCPRFLRDPGWPKMNWGFIGNCHGLLWIITDDHKSTWWLSLLSKWVITPVIYMG